MTVRGSGRAGEPRGSWMPQRRSRRVPTRGTVLAEAALWETTKPSRDHFRRSSRLPRHAVLLAVAARRGPSSCPAAARKMKGTACGQGMASPLYLMGKRGRRMAGELWIAKKTEGWCFRPVCAGTWELLRRRIRECGVGGMRWPCLGSQMKIGRVLGGSSS